MNSDQINLTSIPQGDDEDMLTIVEVAAILRVPVNTLRWWRHQGTGPRFFKMGRRLVVTLGDLRAWIAAQRANDGSVVV